MDNFTPIIIQQPGESGEQGGRFMDDSRTVRDASPTVFQTFSEHWERVSIVYDTIIWSTCFLTISLSILN